MLGGGRARRADSGLHSLHSFPAVGAPVIAAEMTDTH